ncbi:MAG: ribonuclease P [Lentisphaerae bacterium ADurb.Bin242]|nr:MAG: ribonuclease P [Lentisphaerae bacterium ADurb.Bin242]
MKQTRKNTDRLKLKSEFSAVRENARKEVSRFAVMLYTLPDSTEIPPNARCGVVCSRKFDKRAVKRNRARRLLLEAFRLTKQKLAPCQIIFIPRKDILHAKMQHVAVRLEGMFQKAGLLEISRK